MVQVPDYPERVGPTVIQQSRPYRERQRSEATVVTARIADHYPPHAWPAAAATAWLSRGLVGGSPACTLAAT